MTNNTEDWADKKAREVAEHYKFLNLEPLTVYQCDYLAQALHQAVAAERERIAETTENTARTIRGMAQKFVSSPLQKELAIVRAEALEEHAKAIRARND